MNEFIESAYLKAENIRKAGMSIYDSINMEDPDFWITSPELTAILNTELVGISFAGIPIKTRSKRLKETLCSVLGYKIPKTFKKTQPRFLGQNFDTYVQKARNFQIWNEEIDPNRRYVIIILNKDDVVTYVKIYSGIDLAFLDKTKTLTQKYQARLVKGTEICELISPFDTDNISPLICKDCDLADISPISNPVDHKLLSILSLFERLKTLIGHRFNDLGSIQDRNRGGELHKAICKTLGFSNYLDNGKFPDIRNQLLEVKLQTSPTIDLGLVTPNSEGLLDIPSINDINIRHCDVR
ncbi:MAG TPA: hypothetical protein VFG54_12005, partial [Prolixibacteraceae bacterium]|nr:hypothetical protein [Prolixibacteraceae bacterium]